MIISYDAQACIPTEFFFLSLQKIITVRIHIYEQSLAVLSFFPTEHLPVKWFSHPEDMT